MSTKIDRWFVSDLHLGHERVLEDRGFLTVDEMDEALLSRLSMSVNKDSVLYVLGDVSVAGPRKEECFLKLARVECTKILIGGNHDSGDLPLLRQVFHRVFGAHVLGTQNWVLSHIPVHPDCLGGRFAANVHGHMHTAKIHDHRYLNLSVEQTGGWPLHIDEVKKRLREQYLAAHPEHAGQ